MKLWKSRLHSGNRIVFTITSIDDLNSADHDGFCSSFAPNYIDVCYFSNYDRILKTSGNELAEKV